MSHHQSGRGPTQRLWVLGALLGLIWQLLTASPASAASAAAGGSQLFAWGSGIRGELGPGTPYDTQSVSTPTQVTTDGVLAGKTVTDIRGSVQWSCAVADGQVYCWGNSGSPFGIATKHASADQQTALPVDARGALAGLTVTDLSISRYSACVVASGAAYCWGSLDVLGTGVSVSPRVPTAVNIDGGLNGRTVQQISTQNNYACAAADGRAYCWGDNRFGTLGNGTTTASTVPVAVDTSGVLSGKYVSDVGATRYAACALASGQVYCWGEGSMLGAGYEYGSPAMMAIHTRPVAVDRTGALKGKTVTALDVSDGSVCVLADGQPVCWGYPSAALETQWRIAEVLAPSKMVWPAALAGKKATQIALGGNFGCVLVEGRQYCWGTNVRGQLGTGDNTGRSTPTLVGGPLTGLTVTRIAAGASSEQAFAITGTAPSSPTLDTAPGVAADSAPFGYWDRGVLAGANYSVGGWAVDPNKPTQAVDVQVVDSRPDGTRSTWTVRTGGSRPDVTAAISWFTGQSGFDALLHLKGAGVHVVCVTSVNSGPGPNGAMGCRSVTVPPISGAFTAKNDAPGSISVDGWSADPNNPGRKVTLRLTVSGPDGTTTVSGWKTGLGRPALLDQVPWVGVNSGFNGAIPVTAEGTYSICGFAGDAVSQTVPLGCQQVVVQNAFGAMDPVGVTPEGSQAMLYVTGWVIDPNRGSDAAYLRIAIDRDFPTVGAELFASAPRADVAAAYPQYGERHGFGLQTFVPAGTHRICVQAVSTGGGVGNVLVGCQTVTTG